MNEKHKDMLYQIGYAVGYAAAIIFVGCFCIAMIGATLAFVVWLVTLVQM